jgi:hypothetical protein
MPLLDHFHPPLSLERRWESFHAAWSGSLADLLNRILPSGYFAEEQSHAGAGIEIDVATCEQAGGRSAQGNGPATAVLPAQVWAPPAPVLTVPAVFADDFEVRVFSTTSGPRLVAAIELVSPRNKDQFEARRAFATRCASYLYQGISLIVVDIVTERQANLHNEILRLVRDVPAWELPPKVHQYAVAYRPLRRAEREEIDIWPVSLPLGTSLLTLPLALNASICLPVDLEATYMDACRRRRLV